MRDFRRDICPDICTDICTDIPDGLQRIRYGWPGREKQSAGDMLSDA